MKTGKVKAFSYVDILGIITPLKMRFDFSTKVNHTIIIVLTYYCYLHACVQTSSSGVFYFLQEKRNKREEEEENTLSSGLTFVLDPRLVE